MDMLILKLVIVMLSVFVGTIIAILLFADGFGRFIDENM